MPIVAALDLSIRATGFATLSAGNVLDYGHTELRTYDQVHALVERLTQHDLDLVAIEDAYVSVNARTALQLVELRGRVLQELDSRRIPVQLVAPSAWRKTTIAPPAKAKRAALKTLARSYVLQLFGIEATSDEADAICLAAHVSAPH